MTEVEALPMPTTAERIIEGQIVPYGQWLEVDNSREGHFLTTKTTTKYDNPAAGNQAPIVKLAK